MTGYNEKLANRIRKLLNKRKSIEEKKMFGGLSFLLNGKMCCGIIKDDLVVRVGPENYEDVLTQPHTRPMDFTGRPIKGFVYVNSKGLSNELTLRKWVNMSLSYVSSLARKR